MTAPARMERARAVLPGFLVILALAAGAVTLAIVATHKSTPTSRAQQVQQIAAGLHCPICKDLSVADSPAPLAQQMRQQIAEKIDAGESADEIRASFVAAYGDSVLMTPPRHGLGQAAYFLPLAVIAFAVLIAFLVLRRWLRKPASEQPDSAAAPLSASQRRALYKAVARLREEEPG